MPDEYYKKAFLKSKEKVTVVKKSYDELMEEAETCFSIRNMPTGQRHVLESTAVSHESTVIERDLKGGEETAKSPVKVQEETSLGDGDPFLNVTAKKKVKKERQRDKKEEDAKRQKEELCSHFHAGKCRHGFGGDKPYGDTQKCRLLHQKVCRKFLNNGTHKGGCSNGDTCELLHLKMCHFSLKDRKCPNLKPGQRCDLGYLLV